MKFIDLPSSFWAEKKVIEFRVTQSRIPVSITSRKWGLIKKENKCPTEDGKYNRSVEDHKRICCHSFVWESNLRKRMVLCCSSEPRIMYRASGFDEKPTRPQPIESCNILAPHMLQLCRIFIPSRWPWKPCTADLWPANSIEHLSSSTLPLLASLLFPSPPLSFPLLSSSLLFLSLNQYVYTLLNNHSLAATLL